MAMSNCPNLKATFCTCNLDALAVLAPAMKKLQIEFGPLPDVHVLEVAAHSCYSLECINLSLNSICAT